MKSIADRIEQLQNAQNEYKEELLNLKFFLEKTIGNIYPLSITDKGFFLTVVVDGKRKRSMIPACIFKQELQKIITGREEHIAKLRRDLLDIIT